MHDNNDNFITCIIWVFDNLQRKRILISYVYKNRTMNMDIQVMYVIMSIGCRTNGLSNQLVVGPMGFRTNGLSDHREVTARIVTLT